MENTTNNTFSRNNILQTLEKESDPMAPKAKATISDAVTKDWLTKAEFADELNIEVNNLNQILVTGPKAKKFPKPVKNVDVILDGTKNLYSPKYVAVVAKAREGVATRKSKNAVRVIASPDLTELRVQLYKNQLALLESVGITQGQLSQKFKSIVDETVAKVQTKLNEVKNSISL